MYSMDLTRSMYLSFLRDFNLMQLGGIYEFQGGVALSRFLVFRGKSGSKANESDMFQTSVFLKYFAEL